MIRRYLWRNLLSGSLLLTLATIGITIHPTADYLHSIASLVPFVQSVFIVSLFLVGVSIIGLAWVCEDWRRFRLSLGRSIYLPALAGIALALITHGVSKQVILNVQFLVSTFIFVLGFTLSWTS